jgi:hypothetical protein
MAVTLAMPDSAELQAWSNMFAGGYASDLWSGSPREFISSSTSQRNDPAYLRFYQALGARQSGEPVNLQIENLGPDGVVGTISFSGKSHRLKLRGGTVSGVSGILEYGQDAINFAAEGSAAEMRLWFWSSNFVKAPNYPDVICIRFKPDKSSSQRESNEQVFVEGGFTFRYPVGWTVAKEKSRLLVRADRWFGDSVLQILCFETHGSGQAVVAPLLEALVQLMTAANSKDQSPETAGKIKAVQAFGKSGSLIRFKQTKWSEQQQWTEARIRTFVVFHEDVAVVLWAEGGPDDVKQRDQVLLKIFSTFSGNKPPIASHTTRENNPPPVWKGPPPSREKVIEALTNYLSVHATTGRDLFLHIRDHPELLTGEAIETFDTLVRQAKLEQHPGAEQMIHRHEILLQAQNAVSGGYWEMVLANAKSGG